MKKKILLVDLPTFPKNTLALSLYAVAAAFDDRFAITIVDLNHTEKTDALDEIAEQSWDLIGMKVSCQNYHLAQDLSRSCKKVHPHTSILWGGEYPTLLPEEALAHCDSIVSGLIDPVAQQLNDDLFAQQLQPHYRGSSNAALSFQRPPRLDLIPSSVAGTTAFMGLPLETSRGCNQRCIFCLVHTMQQQYHLKSIEQLEKELPAYAGQFINVIDYNIGVDREHVIRVANTIGASEALGWMAEMCLESMDDDEMLYHLQQSRCKMIYCGLESIQEDALRSVNKARTNQVSEYERIIRKVQSYGIQIAAGIILGLAGTNARTFSDTLAFFNRIGIIYAKLTYLIYNPGTKVHVSMQRVGQYQTQQIELFDGNHLTFLPNGVDAETVYSGAEKFIRGFYSWSAIIRRARIAGSGFWDRLEFICFSYCYSWTYQQWLQNDLFKQPGSFEGLLKKTVQRPLVFRWMVKVLTLARQMQYRAAKRSSLIETPVARHTPPKTISTVAP